MPEGRTELDIKAREGSRFMRWLVRVAIGLTIVALLGGGVWAMRGGSDNAYVTFAVRRGPLDVKVLEGGNIEALESQEIRSEVQGYPGTKILSIVEEGHYVTEEEAAEGKILVELDSSEFEDKHTTALISIKGTEASLTEARQGYEIQINQSESDIYSAGVELKFAKMELEKFLGKKITDEVLAEVAKYGAALDEAEGADLPGTSDDEPNITESAEAAIAAQAGATPEAPADAAGPADSGELAESAGQEAMRLSLQSIQKKRPEIDFSKYAKPQLLGEGEANQQLRKFENDLLLARKDLGATLVQLEGARKLYEQDFVTKIEYENTQLDYERKSISVATAESAQDLFIRYEFPKSAEKLLSDYIQAMRKLQRTEKMAMSQLAGAEAKLLAAEARYKIETENIKELEDQIAKCTMRAERPGLVVYGGGEQMFFSDNDAIKEGAVVRERQTIITIPDTTKMGVKVKIHESDIKQVKPGQKVRIQVDAQTDTPLTGEVTKVSVLPNSEDRWMNPDLKVYETTIKIDGTATWLKPGMTAEVEILIETIPDTLYVPIQSVVPQGEEQVCFVLKNGTPERRVVETGALTVEYIAIASGLEEGEEVLIRPPAGSRRDEKKEGETEPEPEPETPPAPALATGGTPAP